MVCKSGLWAPVAVAVEYQDMAGYRGGILLEVSTADCDGMKTVTRTKIIDAVPAEVPKDDFLQMRGKTVRVERTEIAATAYTRLAGDKPEVTLRLVEEGNPDRAVSDPVTLSTVGPRPVSRFVAVALGGAVRGFAFPNDANAGAGGSYRGGRVELARIESVREMPDQWFGYEGADLILLPTGAADREFVGELFNSESEQAARKRRALLEWVRRGGKLAVFAADKAELVAASPDFAPALPAAIAAAPRVRGVALAFADGRSLGRVQYPPREVTQEHRQGVARALGGGAVVAMPESIKPGYFAVASLAPPARGTPFTPLLRGEVERPDGKTDTRLLAAQAPLGLGRVTLVALDPEADPFSRGTWGGKEQFWEWLVSAAGDGSSDRAPPGGQDKSGYGEKPSEDGIAAALRASVDHYDAVPVISFGWVALFILGYTLLIGPIEYVLLKKLFGRLELTWITFPIIVLSVSGAAYLTAYAVKGKDLRLNKIDLLDVDLRTDPARPRVYGRTWFTIFSPRIANYTLGVEPKEVWGTAKDEKGYSPVTTVEWFGPPRSGGGGAGAGREYRYDLDPAGDASPRANGLSGVPIQVWSTKAFAANWSGVCDPANPPAVPTLAPTAAGGALTGTVRFNVKVDDVEAGYAVWKGKVYRLPPSIDPAIPLKPSEHLNAPPLTDDPFRDDPRFVPVKADDEYGGGVRGGRTTTLGKVAAPFDGTTPLSLVGLLFHATPGRVAPPQNASLRPLDFAWRMTADNDRELVLVYKVRRATGSAEAMMTDPAAASPSRLWLGSLPGRGEERAKLDPEAVLQQDTVIRFTLPVKGK